LPGCEALDAIQGGYPLLHISAFDLAQEMSEAESTGARRGLVNQFKRADLLVLEDLSMRHLRTTIAVDSANQVIAAAEVTNRPTDRGQGETMMGIVKSNTGQLPRKLLADVGYFSSNVVSNLTTLGMDVYMPPDKIGHRLLFHQHHES
jgi:hypothetical protein